MYLPVSLFTHGIRTKEVFYFSTDKISTNVPHYFICIKKDETEILLFSCCTTKGAKREEYIQRRGFSLKTLVRINAGADGNPFLEETFIDCNNPIPFTVREFEEMYNSNKIEYKGEIGDDHYLQIILGLLESTEVEQIVKDTLPNPNTIG